MEYLLYHRDTSKHINQERLIQSKSKRIVVKAGRRGGKTVSCAERAASRFEEGRRQLYAAPTNTQTDAFWFEIVSIYADAIKGKVFKVNEAERFIEKPRTRQRIKAKTAWNANTLRGDFADDLYLDEFQLMDENIWDQVGAPMLMDNNGDAVFCFTPPSLVASGVSKAQDPRHASKFYQKALEDTTGLWECIHFTSHDNPYISKEGLALVAADMSLDSYRREIMAEDDDIESSWLVYPFKDTCKVQRFPVDKSWPCIVGHDFGQANPAALFASISPSDTLYIWGEYFPGGKSTAQHVEEFRRITEGYNVVKRVGGNLTTEDEIRQGYGSYGWPIQAPYTGRVNAQIDRVKNLMDEDKIVIFNDLVGLLSELSNCMWVLDGNKTTDKIKDEARYHRLACLRYMASERISTVVQRTNYLRR